MRRSGVRSPFAPLKSICTVRRGGNRGMGNQERRDAYALALQRMTDALLTEHDTVRVLDALARIAGEALGVDRSLIYEIRDREQELVALCEWLNPDVEVTP